MKSYFLIAWRNIWRNKRRTLITIASIFFSLFFALLMRSMQVGSYAQMKKNAVESFSGAIQLHGKGYWAERSFDYLIDHEQLQQVQTLPMPQVKEWSQRIESGLLVAAGSKSKFALVIGADLLREDRNLNLSQKLVAGQAPANSASGVWLAQGLANYLGAQPGDSIVLKGLGYQGQTAEALWPVLGVLRYPIPELNNSLCFMSLPAAQMLFGLHDAYTSVSINLHRIDQAQAVAHTLRARVDTARIEVMPWQEMNPTLDQQIESDEKSGKLMLYLLYLIVGFGIVGTVIMMTTERRREFAVMIAVGMNRRRLSLILAIEMLYIGLLAIAAGMLASLPVLYYLFHHPIPFSGELARSMEQYGMEPVMPFALELSFYLEQAHIVLLMVAFSALLPVWSVARLRVVQALHG